MPFNHGLGGLRASSNAGASLIRSTSTPCGLYAAWLGPTERWREAKHRPTTTARVSRTASTQDLLSAVTACWATICRASIRWLQS